MFKLSSASLQTFIYTPNCVLEDRVQYSTVHIPNVFCDGLSSNHPLCGDCNRQVHRDFLITLYKKRKAYIETVAALVESTEVAKV